MTQASAEQTIVVAAALVAGLWAYEQSQGGSWDVTRFATAWGAVFLVLALVAQASPGLAAAFAILVVAGDLLANGSKLFGQVIAAENQTVAPASTPTKGGGRDVQGVHSGAAAAKVIA